MSVKCNKRATACLKGPSTPVGPKAWTRLCVSRNGTTSGIFSSSPWKIHISNISINDKNNIAYLATLLKRQFMSTWTVSPLRESYMMFSVCRSPSPIM